MTLSTNLGWPSEPEPTPEHRRLGWLARMLNVSRETEVEPDEAEDAAGLAGRADSRVDSPVESPADSGVDSPDTALGTDGERASTPTGTSVGTAIHTRTEPPVGGPPPVDNAVDTRPTSRCLSMKQPTRGLGTTLWTKR